MYWPSTITIVVFLLWSATTYLFSKSTILGIQALGFPDFFRIQLAILKVIAVFILLVPGFPLTIKIAAYSGVGLFLLTALVAHLVNGDSWIISMTLIVLMCLLYISFANQPV